MNLKCIDNEDYERFFVIGDVYQGELTSTGYYKVVSKTGEICTAFKYRFDPVPESTLPKTQLKIYLAGALKNPMIVEVTKKLHEAGHEPFSEWYTPGPEADVLWRDYEQALGYSYRQALKRPSAVNTYNFDKRNIDASDIMLLVLPAGRSAHLELGYFAGTGKPAHILMPEEPERWDVMYQFATGGIHYNLQEFLDVL